MRLPLVAITAAFLAFGVSAPAAGQRQLAQVTVTARVTIPDFLSLTEGETTTTRQADGTMLSRTTVYVTANRTWALTVKAEEITPLELRALNEAVKVAGVNQGAGTAQTHGANGNAIPVLVELIWKSGPG